MTDNLRIGVMGCGNISTTYFRLSPLFKGIEINACADLNADMAKARAQEYGVMAMKPAELLASKDIDLILNLTVPDAHFGVSLAAAKAGKHVYSEKPLVLSMKDGMALKKAADAKKVRVGCAPDTFLGGAHQRARKALDDGEVGKITSGTAHVMGFGMEHWHPNPDFFFKLGGGPILDMGPYYIANLINLIGPVKRVAALTSMAQKSRTISSQPRAGQKVSVKTPTNVQALLEFANGATVTLIASWDVWAHRNSNMELYGTEGSLYVPDPNFFGGEVLATKRNGKAEALADWDHPFGIANQDNNNGRVANYRAAGLADMAAAIKGKRDTRCSLDRTLHGVEVMTSILASGETGKFVSMKTTCTRPKALGPEEARALLK
ncbi:MAG: Gfo/Idh/MocA family oxidoreductase [Aestuariivirga sp.]